MVNQILYIVFAFVCIFLNNTDNRVDFADAEQIHAIYIDGDFSVLEADKSDSDDAFIGYRARRPLSYTTQTNPSVVPYVDSYNATSLHIRAPPQIHFS